MIGPGLLGFLIALSIFVLVAAYTFYYGRNTSPTPSYRVEAFVNVLPPFNPVKEGFGGAARGAGIPDCSRSSAEGAELIGMFVERKSVTEEGSDDLRELTQLVGKLSCFKKDLVSPSHIVEATRYQDFATSHDMEPVAETTARCFAKTISPRDLELAFDKWLGRGKELVRRLCTSYRFSSAEYEKAGKLFEFLVRDVKDIARGSCLKGEATIAGKPTPRDPAGYEGTDLKNVGVFKGYY